jgi:hypothetical protein
MFHVRERVAKGFEKCQTGEREGGLLVSCARRPRTIRMCSVDARSSCPTRPPSLKGNKQAWKEQFARAMLALCAMEPADTDPEDGIRASLEGS